MNEKKCSKCGEVKPLEMFTKCSRNKTGLNTQCKLCWNEKYIKNKEKIKQRVKEYQDNNKDKIKEKSKKYYQNNKEKIREYKQRDDVKTKKRIHDKIYRDTHKEKIKQYKETYKFRRRIKDAEYRKNVLKYNHHFLIMEKLRGRLCRFFNKQKKLKTYSTTKLLGCDGKTLLEWLQWSGEVWDSFFNIENYDTTKYHIDHIKTFADVKKGIYTLEEVCHYTNLQILPATINILKGGTSW